MAKTSGKSRAARSGPACAAVPLRSAPGSARRLGALGPGRVVGEDDAACPGVGGGGPFAAVPIMSRTRPRWRFGSVPSRAVPAAQGDAPPCRGQQLAGAEIRAEIPPHAGRGVGKRAGKAVGPDDAAATGMASAHGDCRDGGEVPPRPGMPGQIRGMVSRVRAPGPVSHVVMPSGPATAPKSGPCPPRGPQPRPRRRSRSALRRAKSSPAW